MVEINNQHQERSSICWRGRRELITDVRKPEIMVMTSLWAENYLQLLRSPSQTCHAKPKTQINRRRTLHQLLSRWWDAYRKQLGLKDFSPKSQDAVWCNQIKERGALPMIDRGDIHQAIDHCSNIWASLPGAGYGQFEHKADSLIAKFKEAGGTVREIDMKPITAIISRSGYHHRLPVVSC